MLNSTSAPLDYYARLGIMTDPKEHAHLFEKLPAEVSALRDVVQGLLVHVFWAERYGLKLSEARKQEVQLRTVSRKLKRILELDDRPLTVARPLHKRLVGNCRDFSVMLCAMLRHQGVPARARCGFGAYFTPRRYDDHWVCEYWRGDQGYWVMVDAELDAFQYERLKIQFDPLTVPSEQFVTGGRAWLMCRNGEAEPDQFSIPGGMSGMMFVQGNLIRDFLALNKIEILPWDGWGLMAEDDESAAACEVELMDHIARLTIGGNETFAQIRALYENDSRLRMPSEWQP